MAPPRTRGHSSDGSGSPAVFKNIKVTIKNESDEDGTPSLSDSDGDKKKGKKKRKRKKEREREKRRKLEKKLAKREQELQMLSEQQRPLLSGKPTKTKTDSQPPKKSVKDRLGVRKTEKPSKKATPPPAPVSRVSSAERKRREELLRRAEIRRQNQERSPIPYPAKAKSRSPAKRRRSRSSQSRSRKRRSSRERARTRSRERRRSGDLRSRRKRETSRPAEKRKRRRRNRGRRRGGGGGGLGGGLKQMDLKEENAEMRAKLADRMATGKPKSTGGKVEERLAQMAGIKRDDPDDDDSDRSDGYDSESDEDMERDGEKVTGKMRSDEVNNDVPTAEKNANIKSGDKWKHDKFEDNADDEDSKDVEKFGKHWRSTRRERSSGRNRNRSDSRSKSRSRSRVKKKRRRGKFSKSRSRYSSTSESSRSRSHRRSSRSYSSRSKSRSGSRSSSRSRSRTPETKVPEDDGRKEGDTNAEKEGVQMELSGALAADTNTVNGTVVKYSEPTEARKPKKKWRLYVFKVSDCCFYVYRFFS